MKRGNDPAAPATQKATRGASAALALQRAAVDSGAGARAVLPVG